MPTIRAGLGLTIGRTGWGRAFLLGWDAGQIIWDNWTPIKRPGFIYPTGDWVVDINCQEPNYIELVNFSSCSGYIISGEPIWANNAHDWSNAIVGTVLTYWKAVQEPNPIWWLEYPALKMHKVANNDAVARPYVFPTTGVVPAVVGDKALPMVFPIASPIAPSNAPWGRPAPNEEPSNAPQPDPQHDPRPDYNLPPLRITVPRPSRTRPNAPRARPETPALPLVSVPPSVSEVVNVLPPATVIDFVPAGPGGASNPVITHPPSNPADRQPPKSVKKQAKVNIAVTMGALWTGLNTVTEVFDFIVAMHDAIPRGVKGSPRLSDKASKAQIIKYMSTHLKPWLHVDFAEGLQNFINMQIGDFIAALGSEQIKKVQQMTGSATGLDHAIRQGQNAVENGSDWTNYVPLLDIDTESGSVSITVNGNAAVQLYWR